MISRQLHEWLREIKTLQLAMLGQQVAAVDVQHQLIVRLVQRRDYLDFAALTGRTGVHGRRTTLATFDALYPQANGESALMQFQIQLATAKPPYDLDENAPLVAAEPLLQGHVLNRTVLNLDPVIRTPFSRS